MTDYTDQQILSQAREALFNILAGSQSYTIAGRTMTKADIGIIREIIREYQILVDEAGDHSGGRVLVQFGQAN